MGSYLARGSTSSQHSRTKSRKRHSMTRKSNERPLETNNCSGFIYPTACLSQDESTEWLPQRRSGDAPSHTDITSVHLNNCLKGKDDHKPNRTQRTANSQKEDAPHLYISWSLHCFRPMTRRYAIFIPGESNDFFLVDVRRNCRSHLT